MPFLCSVISAIYSTGSPGSVRAGFGGSRALSPGRYNTMNLKSVSLSVEQFFLYFRGACDNTDNQLHHDHLVPASFTYITEGSDKMKMMAGWLQVTLPTKVIKMLQYLSSVRYLWLPSTKRRRAWPLESINLKEQEQNDCSEYLVGNRSSKNSGQVANNNLSRTIILQAVQ